VGHVVRPYGLENSSNMYDIYHAQIHNENKTRPGNLIFSHNILFVADQIYRSVQRDAHSRPLPHLRVQRIHGLNYYFVTSYGTALAVASESGIARFL
jgi:hypothetical protein